MIFDRPLVRWAFSRREKRFFIYGCEDGQVAHCANTGSMKGLLGAKYVWVRDKGPENTGSLQYSAELLELEDGVLVGINTMRTNGVAVEGLRAGLVTAVGVPVEVKVEAKWDAGTRFDVKMVDAQKRTWWGEVKNVTLAEGGVAMFPDAVTERGAKHLRVLQEVVKKGDKALQIYVVTRGDVQGFRAAVEIDAVYAKELKAAVGAGVEVVVLGCSVTPAGITVDKCLPFVV